MRLHVNVASTEEVKLFLVFFSMVSLTAEAACVSLCVLGNVRIKESHRKVLRKVDRHTEERNEKQISRKVKTFCSQKLLSGLLSGSLGSAWI